MTATPNFDDLTPPDELVARWLQNVERNGPASDRYRFGSVAKQAARWGARHGWEQARQLWPEPICDRPPTEADADAAGRVQVLIDTGGPLPSYWSACDWKMVGDRPWLHTFNWQPRQPSLQEQALQFLGTIEKDKHYLPEITDTIRRALEQAGEGQP